MRATETDIVVQELKDENGATVFGWRFVIDGADHADGYEATREEAMRKAKMVRSEWEDAGRDE